MVVPIYNAELAPKNLRGRLVSLNQLAITAGIMVSFVADLVGAMFTVGWRVALGVQCVFGLFLIIGMLFLPETPRYACGCTPVMSMGSDSCAYIKFLL